MGFSARAASASLTSPSISICTGGSLIKEYLPIQIAVREEAISIYPTSSECDEEYRWGLERFIVEARTLAKYQHPNIVKVLNVFEANHTAYMVMGYEDGESFSDALKRRKTLEEAELLMVLRPIADGLEKIHQSGFIHRDIKPANIFIRKDGSPVLLDFGSARDSMGEHTRTMTRILSPGYAPIEQYYGEGEEQGPWTDIYGLAATLYRGIAGDAPMDALARSQGILRNAREGSAGDGTRRKTQRGGAYGRAAVRTRRASHAARGVRHSAVIRGPG